LRRDQLIQHISASLTPVTTTAAATAIGLAPSAESLAAVDLLLALSPEVRALSEGWVAAQDTPDRRVLSALRAYAEAHPEKRVFRGAAALGHLPAEDQMTDQQLRELLSRTGEFQLLANAMIKRGA
jgi:hypothetical protein